MLRFLALLCCIAFSKCIQHPLVAEEVHQDDYEAWQAREMLKNVLGSNADGYELKDVRLGFSWDNCGSASDAIQVHSLTVSPDPIVIPGSVNVSLDASVTEDIVAPTSVSLQLKRKLFGAYIEIPCVDNVGSCTYNDPCSELAKFTCPEIFKEHGINCRCPIKKNEYKLPASLIEIPAIKIPSFLENGDYKIQAILFQGSTHLACYVVEASLKAK